MQPEPRQGFGLKTSQRQAHFTKPRGKLLGYLAATQGMLTLDTSRRTALSMHVCITHRIVSKANSTVVDSRPRANKEHTVGSIQSLQAVGAIVPCAVGFVPVGRSKQKSLCQNEKHDDAAAPPVGPHFRLSLPQETFHHLVAVELHFSNESVCHILQLLASSSAVAVHSCRHDIRAEVTVT